jgi:hypothetical protein
MDRSTETLIIMLLCIIADKVVTDTPIWHQINSIAIFILFISFIVFTILELVNLKYRKTKVIVVPGPQGPIGPRGFPGK